MTKLTQNLIPFLLIFLAGLAVGGVIVYTNLPRILKEEALPSQEVAQTAINYINEILLKGEATASLINVVEENGLYKLRLKVGDQEFDSYVSKDGKLLFPGAGIDLEEKPQAQPQTQEEKSTIGNFRVSEDEICYENEKPLVFFFGSERCPHCVWEHPIVEEVTEGFKDYILFHNNMDSQADAETFQKYSTGGIPTLVLGCKYYRVGSGERVGEEGEKKNLTALICKLTGNEPANVCDPVSDLINQIGD